MIRARACIVLLGCLAAALGAVPAEAADPEDLTLRLADLGPGYRVGDDSGCGMTLSEERAAPVLVSLQRRHAQRNCGIQLERLWAAPDRPAGPRVVESLAFVFRRTAGAAAGLEAADSLAAYTFGLPRAQLERIDPAPAMGDAAVAYRTGRGTSETIVAWRAGRVLALLLAAADQDTALRLAAVQQARIERPTPLRPGENDDREVPLDDPRLGGTVRWLGPSFRPGGGLPRLALADAFVGGPGPGWFAQIDYRARQAQAGVTLGLWKPRAWARFTRTRLGRLVWAQRCSRAHRLRVPGGRAVIYAGIAEPRRQCGRRDRFLAHVHLRDVVVSVNIPVCLMCAERGGGADPYDSRKGMRAVAGGLRLRVADG